MIAKGCPKCDQQVPVACKACPCGHSFFHARRTSRVLSPEVTATTSSSSTSTGTAAGGEDIRRRTQRVRREKPDYYDALEYDKQVKKTRTRNSECDDEDYTCKRDPSKPRRKKVKKEDDDDDEIANNLSTDRQLQCSLILAELNRKMQLVTWKPT